MTAGNRPRSIWSLASLWRTTLDIIFPPRCVGCGRPGALLCSSCLGSMPRLLPPYCQKCGKPFMGPRTTDIDPLCPFCRQAPLAIDGVRSPYLFTGVMREAIHAFKYKSLSSLAPTLAHLLAEHLLSNPVPVEVIVPVPLHPQRRRERGYDQAQLLASYLAQEVGLPLGLGWVVRQRPTLPQVKAASAAHRKTNMREAFTPGPKLEGGRAVLLVDDVCTTGATLDACAQALRFAGTSASVWGLTLAREA